MNSGVSKARTRRSPVKISKATQGKLLNVDAGTGMGIYIDSAFVSRARRHVNSSVIELPPSRIDRSLAVVDLAQSTTPLQSRKRQLDGPSTSDSLLAKRARLTQTDAQTRRHSVMPARWVKHTEVLGTGASRRSARLQKRQHSTGNKDPICVAPLVPFREPQIEAGARNVSLPSKQVTSPRTNIQPPRVEYKEVEKRGKTIQQSKPPKPLYTTLLKPMVEGREQVSLVTQLQKWHIGGDIDHQPKQARLTWKNLALFNKMAKKKGTINASASGPPESTVQSLTKSTSIMSSGFAIQAYENGILDPRSSKPPKNLEAIRERLTRTRTTASPPESRYKNYVNRVEGACNEATMVFEVGRHLLKEYDDEGYKRAFNQTFTGFPKDVGFNNGLSAPQPDFAEGLEMREYRPFPINEHVDGAVLYKDDPYSLTLPHVAGEWKGPRKDMEEARLRCAYDGAAFVYARNEALSYVGRPDPDGHAEIMTFTTDGTNLNLFAHYAATSEDSMLEYHQYPVLSANVKKSHQEFKDGRRGLRNEQDHARKQSYTLRDQLKNHWKAKQDATPPAPRAAASGDLGSAPAEPWATGE